MPKSDASWSGKLRQVTALELPDHYRLRAEDRCYFVGEYTPRAGYAHSATNGLIVNLKKKPSTRGTYQWPHKMRAIKEAGAAIGGGIKPAARSTITYVPIPPSKMRGDPEYDDRMLLVARAIGGGDVRELFDLQVARDAAHNQENTRDPEVLKAKLRLRTDLLSPPPQMIALVDDVLTTGCSFRACSSLLEELMPNVPIIGLFVARRILSNAALEFENLDF